MIQILIDIYDNKCFQTKRYFALTFATLSGFLGTLKQERQRFVLSLS